MQRSPHQMPVPAPGRYPAVRVAPARATLNSRLPVEDRPDRLIRSLLFLTGLVLVFVIVAVTAVGTAVLIYRSDLILPGTLVSGIGVGGKYTEDAAAFLQQKWHGPDIVLDGGDQAWSTQADRLGILLDTRATAQLAYDQSRSPTRVAALRRGVYRVNVPPIWTVDAGLASSQLQALADEFALPAVDARIAVVDGRVVPIPAVDGRLLDVDGTVSALMQDVNQVIAAGRVQLAATPVSAAITDVSPAISQAQALLEHPPSILAYDPVVDKLVEWTVPQDEWAQWLVPSVDAQDLTRLTWDIDTARANSFATGQAAALAPDRYLNLAEVASLVETQSWGTRLRIYHHPLQHTVQPGDTLAGVGRQYGIPYPWLQQANPGLADTLRVGQAIIIPSPDDLLPLPVVENKRIVVSISSQMAWVYEGGALKWEWPVSTGIASSPTSPGVFQVQTHEPNAYAANWDLWMPHFMGIYRPVPTSDFMNGFHGFPTRGGTQLLWTNNLGHPVTYGCILLGQENAAALYDWAEEGTVVEIRP